VEEIIIAAKRKTKRLAKPREDLSAPSKWHAPQGAVSVLIREADLETGTPAPHRCVFTAIDALGGDDDPQDSCIWIVVGSEMTEREWSARSGWCGRLVSQPFAGMILIAVIAVLASESGFQPSSRKA
jgi:hypothetical protein